MKTQIIGQAPQLLLQRLASLGAVDRSSHSIEGESVVLVLHPPQTQGELTTRTHEVLSWAGEARRARSKRLTILELSRCVQTPELEPLRAALTRTAVRYLAGSLFPDGLVINAVRSIEDDTHSLAYDVVVSLCSGLLDAMSGQVLEVHQCGR